MQAWREAARSRPEWMRSTAKSALFELGHLIFHQGDQRADHERGAAARDAGQLVAERLARAGGHDQQDVAAVDDGLADGFLVGAEGGEAEGGLQEFGEGSAVVGRSRSDPTRPTAPLRSRLGLGASGFGAVESRLVDRLARGVEFRRSFPRSVESHYRRARLAGTDWQSVRRLPTCPTGTFIDLWRAVGPWDSAFRCGGRSLGSI